MSHNQSNGQGAEQSALRRALLRGAIIVFALFLAAELLGNFTFALIRPHLRAMQLRSENTTLEKMVIAKRQEKKDLEQRIQWWTSPSGEEELAHTQGLVKPGEHTLVLLPPKAAAAAQSHQAPSVVPAFAHHTRLIAAGIVFLVAFLLGIGLLVRRYHLLSRRPANTLKSRAELRRHAPTT